jgi:hypothetical protein
MMEKRGLGRNVLLATVLVACLGALPGCETGVADYPNPTQEKYEETGGSLLGGEGGFRLGDITGKDREGGSGIGVNSFLWRASLDTISFMPLISADPFGGVIITDWYAPPESPGERVKITVYILGRDLRADGIRAAVFRQRRDAGGDWVDAAVEKRTQVELEDAILTRARQLRVAGLQ